MHRDCVQIGKGDEVSGGCGYRIKGMKRSGEVLKGHLTVRLTLLIVALIAYLNYVKFELSSQFTRICLIIYSNMLYRRFTWNHEVPLWYKSESMHLSVVFFRCSC